MTATGHQSKHKLQDLQGKSALHFPQRQANHKMQLWTPYIMCFCIAADKTTYWVILVQRFLTMGRLCRCESLTMGCLCRCECLTMVCLCRCECLTVGCLCRCECLTMGCLCRCECLTMGCLCRSSQGSSGSFRHTGPNCPKAPNNCPLQPCHMPLFLIQPKMCFLCSTKSVSYAAQKMFLCSPNSVS